MGVLADYVIRHHYPHLQEQGEQQPWAGSTRAHAARQAAPAAQLLPAACRLLLHFVFAACCTPLCPSASALLCLWASFVLCCAPYPPPRLCAGGNKYAAFLTEVAQRTGRLFAEWHRVGFVHGVLNTDNMSIMGDTIGGQGVRACVCVCVCSFKPGGALW